MDKHWYGVKCIFEHGGLSEEPGAHVYEERVVVLRASTFDEAMIRAEEEAEQYASRRNAVYCGYCNSFSIAVSELADLSEVYSVMREMKMGADEFVDHYYDDGTDKHS
jgi:hypothetical protein